MPIWHFEKGEQRGDGRGTARMPKENSRKESSEQRRPKEIDPKDIQGLKYFKVLRPFLKRLHDVGTERDRAQNRELHMDQYCIMVLLWQYSPIVDSLRGLQQASQLKKIQKQFDLPQSSLGSLSESVRIFDPEALKQIAAELAEQLPEPVVPKNLEGVKKKPVAVDGSFVPILARIAKLAWKWRKKVSRHAVIGCTLISRFCEVYPNGLKPPPQTPKVLMPSKQFLSGRSSQIIATSLIVAIRSTLSGTRSMRSEVTTFAAFGMVRHFL